MCNHFYIKSSSTRTLFIAVEGIYFIILLAKSSQRVSAFVYINKPVKMEYVVIAIKFIKI